MLSSVRRIVCTRLGSLDHLEVEERPDLRPRPGQLIVAVEAAGVTAVDALIVLGRYPLLVPTPFVPGHEIAGTVVAVGEGAAGFTEGDRVIAMQGLGGFASQVPLAPLLAMRAPPSLSVGQAGSLLQAYSTAAIALEHRLAVRPGERVLVLGAGGGVGLAVVDLATTLGAVVIAAASTEAKRAAALAAGAVEAVDAVDADFPSVDVVVDLTGGPEGPRALAALRSGGRYGLVGGGAAPEAAFPAGTVLQRNRTILGIDCGDFAMRDGATYYQLMLDVLRRAEEGTIAPAVPTERPLDDAAAVLADLLDRRVTGKVVLVP